jgi:hypothetical protein
MGLLQISEVLMSKTKYFLVMVSACLPPVRGFLMSPSFTAARAGDEASLL